ncbi:hypothetical protein KZ483_02560 [Paenibacillus sp. sptzw28]|uniref:hypothetical protein n=1 Tax=Paenibacillus sp. sptzw28 TaxID=715179 RepID=UPI001C6E38E1|nr:hypothetical protein [Paenibacillus sp. sptzw28]QYR21938.1 hypothetical protein KZ483_02560 [Paenibacillus sp. sptzw28]
MDDQNRRAQELFNYYHGSFVHMHREGNLEEYRSYGISKETEIEWFKELIRTYTVKLSIRDWDAVNSLGLISSNYQDKSILENVVSFTQKHVMSSDSVVKLMYAESIIRILKTCRKVISNDLLFDACRVVVRILEDIVSGPLILDPGHELTDLALKDKRSLNSRAQKDIEEIKSILNYKD